MARIFVWHIVYSLSRNLGIRHLFEGKNLGIRYKKEEINLGIPTFCSNFATSKGDRYGNNAHI